jgi:hypothetical protein
MPRDRRGQASRAPTTSQIFFVAKITPQIQLERLGWAHIDENGIPAPHTARLRRRSVMSVIP